MDNKVFILNYWWAQNYGAILTAFALHKLIDNSILLNNSDIYRIDNKFNFADKFANKYFCSSEYYNSFESFNMLNKENATFIVGSDQVFRHKVNTNISESFLLGYINSNSKKIAFSASFGVDEKTFLTENNEHYINKIRYALQAFDYVSVREKSGVKICKDVLEVDAEWIIDPIFIVELTTYNTLIQDLSAPFENKYVSYLIHKKNKILNKYNGEKVYALANSNVTVEEWLIAIKKCKLLITDSFHGMCFAIMFNKPFIAISNGENSATRFDSICEMLGIENQCISLIDEIYNKDCIFKVDYEKVNKRIEEERQRGLEFLKKAIEASVCKQKEKEEIRTRYLEEKICELEEQANLKYQLKIILWHTWLIIFHKYLPEPIKNIIRKLRGKRNA